MILSEIKKLDMEWQDLLAPYLDSSQGQKTINRLDKFLASKVEPFLANSRPNVCALSEG